MSANAIDVALTRSPPMAADVCIVVDCIRASTVIAHALAAGYRRVVCVNEIEEALAAAAATESSVLGGERDGRPISGFALGNSPADFSRVHAADLVLTTTNGTRAIVTQAAQAGELLCGALVNLEAVARAAAAIRGDIVICCAGIHGRPALDDTFVAGRYVRRLIELLPRHELTDAARVALSTAHQFRSPREALETSTSAQRLRDVGLERDIADCARVSTLTVVPRLTFVGPNRAELRAG